MAVVNDAHAAEHARLDPSFLVTNLYGDLESTGLRVDDRADARHRGHDALSRERIDVDGDGLSGLDLAIFALGHVQVGYERFETGDPEGGLTDANCIADPDVTLGHDAGDRRTDLRVVELQGRQVVRCFERFEIVAQFLEVSFGDQAFLAQFLVTLEVTTHFVEACA